jgi:hypothetical protein
MCNNGIAIRFLCHEVDIVWGTLLDGLGLLDDLLVALYFARVGSSHTTPDVRENHSHP